MILFEDVNDVHIYMDDETGNYYYYDGSKLVLMGRKPQIGDRGSKEFQDKEEEERNKKIEQEKEEEEGDEGDTDGDDSGDDSGDGEAGNGAGNKGDADVEDSDSKLSRLERIKDLLNDKDIADKISHEAEDKVTKERLAKASKELNKYKNSPLNKFKESLQSFIKKEIGEVKSSSWSKINKKYAGTGTIKAGTSKHASGKIPLINVYFDRSGSWDSSKTKVGEQAIATLNNYVRQHKLKIDLYYFNTEIHSVDPGGTGGTLGAPILEHIKKTKPDNVIVMTDDDIMDCTETVTVPGAVWLLFKGGVSSNLQEHLKGKKLTRSFELQ